MYVVLLCNRLSLHSLLQSDATRHAVRRKPAISVVSPAPRPLTATIDPPQPIFLGFLRKFLLSRMHTVPPIRTNEPHNPLDVCFFHMFSSQLIRQSPYSSLLPRPYLVHS
jgi:hypothetical protein